MPDPLPPDLPMEELTFPLGDARDAIGELRGACRLLLNPYVLIRPMQRLEAQTSSAMEGTYTTADALALAEAGIEEREDALEVANYTRALSWAVATLSELPLSNRLFKGAHERLLHGVGYTRGEDKRPGQFKRDQNMIGGSRLERARFIPPPPAETEAAMADLERYLNAERVNRSASLIAMALAHYQFETIHPFADGNGRVGRMLISLMGLTERLVETPVLYMSPDLEARKDEYIDLMYRVSAEGDWVSWITFFLEILTLSCQRTTATVHRLLDLQTRYRETAALASRSANTLTVVDMVFETPAIQPRMVIERTGVTDAAARTLLRRLTEIGILRESTDYYPTVWFADEVLAVSRPL